MKIAKLLIIPALTLSIFIQGNLPVASSNPDEKVDRRAVPQPINAHQAQTNEDKSDVARQAIITLLYTPHSQYAEGEAVMRVGRHRFIEQYGDAYGKIFDQELANIRKKIESKMKEKIKKESELKIPTDQLLHLQDERTVPEFLKWIQENPRYINSLAQEDLAVPLILYVIKNFSRLGDIFKQLFDCLVRMGVDLSAEDVLESNALYYAVNINENNHADVQNAIKIIASRFIHTNYDLQVLLRDAEKWLALQQRGLAHALKQEKEDNDNNESFALETLTPIRNKIAKAELLIQILKEEVDARKEMEQARKFLVDSHYLVKDAASLIAPSKKLYIGRIKDAIDHDDSKALAEHLDGNKYLEEKDETGYTPLLYAVYVNKPAMVRFLIQQGADTQAKTKDGMNAERLAHNDAMKKLITQERLIREAAQSKRQTDEKLRESQKKSQHSLANAQKLKKLFNAIAEKDHVAVQTNAVPEIINQYNEDYLTPLMMAAMGGDVDIVKELLNNEADTTIQGTNGSTALMLAIKKKKYGAATAIADRMDKEALGIENEDGKTALTLALKDKDAQKDNDEYTNLIEFGLQ